jgi:thioredoxin 1
MVAGADLNAVTRQSPGLWLIEFGAAWCAPCRAMLPTLHDLAGQFSGRVGLAQVHADEAGDACADLKVDSVPTLILFRDGVPVERKVGVMSRSALTRWLKAAAS